MTPPLPILATLPQVPDAAGPAQAARPTAPKAAAVAKSHPVTECVKHIYLSVSMSKPLGIEFEVSPNNRVVVKHVQQPTKL